MTQRTHWKRLLRLVAALTCLTLVAAACGNDDGDSASEEPGTTVSDSGDDGSGDSGDDSGDDDSGDSGSLTSVDLALSTTSGFGYGYHIAANLGFYEEEGYDVTLQGTGGSSDVAQLLAAGNAPVGMGVPGAMLPVIERGADLYPFFTYAYGEVFDVMVPEDSDLQEIADLEGLTLGVSSMGGGEMPLVRALLSEVGLDPDSDVQIIAVGTDAPTVRLSLDNGDIDAFSTAKSDIAAITAAGVELRSIAPDSLDTLPAEGLLASADAQDDDELLIAMGRATAKGQLIAYTSQDAAVCVLKQEIPEEFTDEQAGRDSLAAVLEITTAPENDDGTYQFGFLDADGWNTYVEIFFQGELLEDTFDMTPYVRADLLDEINDFDQQEIIDMANELPTDC